MGFAVFLTLAACSASASPKLSVHDGWARATGKADSAAAYVTIQNMGGADRLTGARSSIGEVMLHESAMEGTVMRMRPIDPGQGLSVPSNGKLVLAPGGAHIMITALKQPLRAGDRFDLTLLFEKSQPQRIAITVQPAMEGAPAP